MPALLNPFWLSVVGDPYFANVVLLLHCDGSNGSIANLIDNSFSAHTVGLTGSSLSTAQQKFGTASLSNTSSSFMATSSDSPDWWFGAGQFTVECWIRPTSAVSGVVGLLTQFGGSSDLGWFFGFIGNTLNFFWATTGTDNPSVAGSYTAPTNQWIHVAADRDASNVLRIYADGVVIASATVTATFWDSSKSFRIANDENSNRGFIGYIDEVRITKGVGRYGGAFTPPTSAFPNF